MNNYEYIIASLPVLAAQQEEKVDFEGILSEIREQLSERDVQLLEFFLKGYDNEALDRHFYLEALGSRNAFVREFFRYDLCLRNAKVEYLNSALGRPEGMDVMDVDCGEMDDRASIVAVLAGNDLVARERGLDNLVWQKIDGLAVFELFSMNAILAFVAKMKIVERWMRLDENSGRELFRRLVKETKETYSI